MGQLTALCAAVLGLLGAAVLIAAGPKAPLSLIGPAHAHRLNAAVTTVTPNERTGRLEVVHEVFLHDLEEAFRRRTGRLLSLEPGARDVSLVVEFIAEQFSVSDPSGVPLPLSLIGAERSGNRLVIYRELAAPPPLAALWISDRILMEDFPAQTNRVDIVLGAGVHSLIFEPGAVEPQQAVPPQDVPGE